MESLQHKIAVVTGASSGIGRAVALALAAQGATLSLVGRNRDALDAVAAAVRDAGSSAQCHVADLADAAFEETALRIASDLPRIDVLIHAAGVLETSSLATATAVQFDAHYRTNVRAPFLLTQALLPKLQASRGQIVFVNSTAGLTARAGVGQYAASKHAFKALADSLREEVNADGIRVLSLFLGRTATAMQAAVHASEGRAYRPELLMQPDDVASVTLHALAMPRTAEVTEITMRPMVKSY